MNCCSSLWTIGPRQMTAPPRSTKKPIDITFMPWWIAGTILLPVLDLAGTLGRAHHLRDRRAVDVGVEDADRGALARAAPAPGWC